MVTKTRSHPVRADGSLFLIQERISLFQGLSALDVVDHLSKPVDLLFGVVKGERWPNGAFHAEAP